MSIHCTSRVWEHSSQKGSPFILLLAIANYADENGFAFPGLATLATRIRMSRRQTMRLVARLEGAGELLVLRREGRGNLYIVRTAAGREALSAALDRAVSFGAPLPGGTIERTLDGLLGVEPQPVTACSGPPRNLPSPPGPLSAGALQPAGNALSPGGKEMSPDKAMSPDRIGSHHCDNPGATGDRSRPTGDRLVTGSGDTTTAPDPSLTTGDPPGTVMDPSAQDLWARALEFLPLYMDRRTFDHWLQGTRALALEGDCLVVQAHTARAVEWLEHRLAPVIHRVLSTYLPGRQVRFVAPWPGPARDPDTDPCSDPGTDPGTPTGAVHGPPIPGPHAPEPGSHANTRAHPVSTPMPPPFVGARDNCFSRKSPTPNPPPSLRQRPQPPQCPSGSPPPPTPAHWHSLHPPPTRQSAESVEEAGESGRRGIRSRTEGREG